MHRPAADTQILSGLFDGEMETWILYHDDGDRCWLTGWGYYGGWLARHHAAALPMAWDGSLKMGSIAAIACKSSLLTVGDVPLTQFRSDDFLGFDKKHPV
jgi:hypothetical protein